MLNKSRYSIINADVILTSSTGETQLIDIRNNVLEVVFYEHLNKPYVDANVVILDDFGLRSSLGTQGTERLSLTIADGTDPTNAIIEKTFFFSKINDVKKTNDRSEVISLSLVEDHVYINAMKQISRSYESTLEDAIINIADRDLGKDIVETTYFTGSAQGERKVIIPYMSPLEAITWLKDRMTTRTGSPIYLSGDLYSNFLYMSGLDGLLQEDVINKKMPLRYSDALQSGSMEQEAEKLYFQIKQFEEVDVEDSLALYEEGAIGSFYSNLDAGSGQAYGSHVTIRDVLDDFYTNGLIDNKSSQSIFDPTLTIQGKLSDEYDAVHIHQVTSSKTYNQFKSYHDETQLFENNELFESRLKVKNKIIRQMLKKNTINIQMNGSLFFERKISPGRRIRIVFLSPNTQGDLRNLSKTIDQSKSGDYLMTAISHRLLEQNHRVTAQMVKLGDLPEDFTL